MFLSRICEKATKANALIPAINFKLLKTLPFSLRIKCNKLNYKLC